MSDGGPAASEEAPDSTESALNAAARSPDSTQRLGTGALTVPPTPSSYSASPEKQDEVWASHSQSTDAPDISGRINDSAYSPDFPACRELAELPRHGSDRPADIVAWEKNAYSKLQEAKQLSHEVRGQLVQNSMSRLPRKFRENVQTGFVTKMGGSSDLAKALQDRLYSVENTIRTVGQNLLSLQRARQAKWAPLGVCEKRLELREGRPLQELLTDYLQEALESEHKCLESSRQELADFISATKDMLATLGATKEDLMQDMHNKRLSRRIDRTCYLDGGRRTPDSDRLVLPTLAEVHHYGSPPSPKGAEPGTGPANDEKWNTDTRALLARAIRTEEDAIHLCNANDAAMLRTKHAAANADAHSTAMLARRIKEYEDMKRRLDDQVVETEAMMCSAERSLLKTRQRLHTHQDQLHILSKQFALREGRAHPEHIRDGVHEKLEDHLGGIKASAKALSEQVDGTQELLDRLTATRHKLMEDLRCKTIALRIDDACLKTQPTKLAIQPQKARPHGLKTASPASLTSRRIKAMQQRAERDLVNHRDLSARNRPPDMETGGARTGG